MPIATGLAIGLGVASAAGSVAGGAIAAHGAGKAADAQTAAANHAADIQHQDAEEALAFQKQQYADQQKNAAPWLQAGQTALGQLSSAMAPGGDLSKQFTEQFQAPTAATEQNDPGYQFRLEQGMKVLQNSAAAKGGLLSGNTAEAVTKFGQDYASNEYSNTYNRAFQEFQNRFNIFNTNQTNEFNRLGAISGVGQTAANQLASSGQAASNNISNTLLTSGAQIGQDINNAGAARASGYVGSANAWGGAIGGASNNIMDLLLLQQLSAKPRSGTI